ncbi:acetyl/propionyl/methylcrotonyl-CoA carboxylase subunit alpha [Calditrichota bacterium]
MPAKAINKILIANRGEIAVRVIRSCREMGIKTVAVYSEADANAQHVLMSDEAYPIGPPPARESYLKQDLIIETARKAGAQAIHPGYGFLSENAEFSQKVSESGLIFIGPPPAAIHSMGSKTEARRIMSEAGVPVVPGVTLGKDPDFPAEKALELTKKEVGFPALIKAAMGGGGKGMRVVRQDDEFVDAFEGARREAASAFGDPEVYIERFVEGPRHIEIQVLADSHDNCIHLYERECSIQRRHQKVIEEAPSPALDKLPELREKMGATAVAAAKACGYVNAGTVEFLFDPERSEFYFLEMNTRLQVEHPVTEMVTGLDLVREQIHIAEGRELTILQNNVRHRGHAIEARIYAEDPKNDFLPDAGTVESVLRPDGPWVRVDSGVQQGSEVGLHYDPMVAKLVVWGPDRAQAIRRMERALSEYRVTGFKTNIPFNIWVMRHPRFNSGEFDTRFIEQEWHPEEVDCYEDQEIVAAIAAALWDKEQNSTSVLLRNGNGSVKASNHDAKKVSWKIAGRLKQMR